MLNDIIEAHEDEEILKADGFDSAVIGIDSNLRLIYSVSKCIQILIDTQGMDYEDAAEYFFFNVESAYVGEKTPIWCEDRF